jgi:hypothetical protein
MSSFPRIIFVCSEKPEIAPVKTFLYTGISLLTLGKIHLKAGGISELLT